MFYSDGLLHAIVDEGLGPSTSKNNSAETEDEVNCSPQSEAVVDGAKEDREKRIDIDTTATTDASPSPSLCDESSEKLSNKQKQKVKRKLKKQQAKERKRHNHGHNGQSEEDNTDTAQPQNSTPEDTEAVTMTAPPPLRLHQFVSTVFRSELNVAENGTGYFIKNAPKVSAHHAILKGVVHLNGKVCKRGKTQLEYGDVVSLQLVEEVKVSSRNKKEGDYDYLVSWRGSEEVAKRLEEGSNGNNGGGRQGRMMASANSNGDDTIPTIQKDANSIEDECDMIKYYREKLGKTWIPDVHEAAIRQPLPLTLRVLKPSVELAKELTSLGFSPVTEKEDFRLEVGCLDGKQTNKKLGQSAMQELVRDTWIARSDNKHEIGPSDIVKRLGLFLSEARVTGEIMQQELTSMLPVAIMTAHLKKKQALLKGKELRFLDLCAAPGSKTCQLISALESVLPADDDFTVVANEISPQRAKWMRQRLHQQCGSKALSNLTITCADGRDYAKMDSNTFDYILCDVPCSGDGTVRKSPKILDKWSLKSAEKNKPLQKELLKVGLGLLKPYCSERNNDTNNNNGGGGILVYSTCSLNPMENEEVISEVMNELNNGNKASAFKFELVDLSEKSLPTISDSNNGCNNKEIASRRNKQFLRVHPAKSHGGFFVASIRKRVIEAEGEAQEVVETCSKNGDASGDNRDAMAMIRRHATNSDTTISYSISPSTQRCCAEIIEKMDMNTIVSSGVAVLYKSKMNDRSVMQILQQGCASLVSSSTTQRDHGHLFGCIQLSHEELMECHAKCTIHQEVSLPADRLRNMKVLAPGTAMIIGVGSNVSGDDPSLLLPARIIRVIHNDNGTGAVESAVVEILARPQIFRRALAAQIIT